MESPMREMPTREDVCEHHGTFKAVNYAGARWSGCGQCSIDEEAKRKAESERLHRLARLSTRLRHSGLSGRYLDATFDAFTPATEPQRKALDACREYAANPHGNLWLIGPPGTGKTHLGSAMVRATIEADRTAEIRSGREMIRMLRSTWGGGYMRDGDGYNEDELVSLLGHVSLLVIDEVGVGFGSEGEQVQMFDVIDLRSRHERPTVLLSNLTAAQLKVAVGERSYDRLRENARVIACDWTSHRGTVQPRKALELVR